MPRPKTLLSVLFAAGLAYAAPLPGQAPPPAAAAQLQVQARQASYDQEKGVIRYSGEVLILRGGLRIDADTTLVSMEERRLKRIEAWGSPVRFQYLSPGQELRRGSCRKLHYQPRDGDQEERLQLEGEALLEQDDASVRGERIVYLPEKAHFHAEGQPVRSTLPLGKEAP